MSKHETPMTRWYWEKTGGTLVEEFLAVTPGSDRGQRLIDAVIILGGQRRISAASEVTLKDQDVIAVQSKRGRLGMYLMGQVVFSAQLLRPFGPRSVRSVAVCERNDSILGPLLLSVPGCEIAIYPGPDGA